MKKQVLLICLTLLLTSCFKTAEEINRERLIDQQLSQSSKIIADLTNQMTELKGGLASTSGQLEEIDHKRKQLSERQQLSYSQTIAQLSEQVKILTSDSKKTQEQITKLSSELKAQKKFIQKVTGTLTKMSGSSSSSNKSLLKQAHRAFEKNQQKNAKSLSVLVFISKFAYSISV
jgi:chromosome segregation ATPase